MIIFNLIINKFNNIIKSKYFTMLTIFYFLFFLKAFIYFIFILFIYKLIIKKKKYLFLLNFFKIL